MSSGTIGAYLFAAAFLVINSDHGASALAIFTLLTTATVAIAWRTEAALWALPAARRAGGGSDHLMGGAGVRQDAGSITRVTQGAIPGPPTGTALHLAFGASLAVIFGLPAFAAQGRTATALERELWSLTGVVVPIVILIALYLRIANLDRSIPFAGLALVLAALYGYATEYLAKRQPQPGLASAAAIYAAGSVASLALALTFALDKGWLNVGLALMVPGIAWISERRPLPALRYLATAIIAVVLLRVGYEPRIVGRDVGTTRSSTGYSMGMACRPHRSGMRAICCAGAPMICPRAWPKRPRSCSRFCSCCSKFAIS